MPSLRDRLMDITLSSPGRAALIGLMTLFPLSAHAFQFSGDAWPSTNATFEVDIVDPQGNRSAPSGTAWNDAFDQAAGYWNNATTFTLDVVKGKFFDPCNGSDLMDGHNGAGFAYDICGSAFGAATLAVELSVISTADQVTLESDIVFNANKNWDVFNGAANGPAQDFRRVALHELGHTLGLGHEDSVPAIMSSLVDQDVAPRTDDINGVQTRYAGGGNAPARCTPRNLPAPTTRVDTLQSGECTQHELFGNQGAAIVDVYQFNLADATTLRVDVSGAQFAPLLYLFNGGTGQLIGTRSGTLASPNASLEISVAAGTYLAVVSSAGNTATTGAYAFGVALNGGPVAAAVLPSSRSVVTGTPATAFASIVNSGSGTARNCRIEPSNVVAADFSYQATDPSNNVPVGVPNSPRDIPSGGVQTFVVTFTPTKTIRPFDLHLHYRCANTGAAQSIPGVNTLLLSSAQSALPDVIALAATTGAGTVSLTGGGGGIGAFAVATVNVGAAGQIVVSTDTGDTALPVAVSICETNASGLCLGPASPSVTRFIGSSETPTFALFVSASAPIPFDPANNRIHVRFKDLQGAVRGSTSVAIMTQ